MGAGGCTPLPARKGPRTGQVGYGPNLAAFAVYLLMVHFIPACWVVELLQSLTGAASSVGFCRGMLARAADALTEIEKRIQTLITPGPRRVLR